ncbi:hypothetical protein BTN49_0769 [Candidatus Enterovibrio escicola]|uniref:Uncharacterized protein n=1 Tax=Candidatus Enterovibrio escicola TaxID=1927127 RepID=A0A2A5T6S7_9GAMM|nr:hypothetical protein BTN49_0769 [Candidatus Enterovibrio escacola]
MKQRTNKMWTRLPDGFFSSVAVMWYIRLFVIVINAETAKEMLDE